MEKRNELYACSVCGKKGVKLWRPYGDDEPLICAVCAEKLQSPMQYKELVWEEKSDGTFIGHAVLLENGKPQMRDLPRWRVDENGNVPDYTGPVPVGCPDQVTDQLIVDLSSISKAWQSGETTIVPACPTKDGQIYSYGAVPESLCEWWRKLPTR